MNYNEYSYDECAEILCNKALEKIKNICDENNISQGRLSTLTGIAQPTISKIFSGEIKMGLAHIAKFCKALNIDPGEIITFKEKSVSNFKNDECHNDSTLIYNPSHLAFKGYVGKFNVYFKSTISTEEEILHGLLEFFPSDDGKTCSADLLLYTGKTKSGSKITKHYKGKLIISISMSSCYCTLISEEIGEMCFLVFDHMFLFNEDLICRMACAITTSSGGNRRPTMHRLLVCKDELNILDNQSDDYKFLSGHLKLNSSDITISEAQLMAIENNEKMIDIKQIINNLKQNSEKETLYKIDEANIRNAKYSLATKVNLISILREYSIERYNNKISCKTDEYVYNYLSNRSE